MSVFSSRFIVWAVFLVELNKMFSIIRYSQQMQYLRTIYVYFNYKLHYSEPSVNNCNQYLNKILSKCKLAKSIVFLLLTQLNLSTANLET